jgi:NDP-sugar pyrophosphorylase family protein
MNRVRITISISPELAQAVDERVDGLHIRNRSHAIESLISDSLHLSAVKTAVVLAGGSDALKRVPAIKQAIASLYQFGVTKIIVAVGYLGPKIQTALADMEREQPSLSYHQSNNGTGGALYELRKELTRPFFVVNVHETLNVDLSSLIRFHREHGPLATIATKHLRDLDGIYILEPEVLTHIPKGFSSLEDEVFVALSKAGKLLSYPVTS